MANKHYSFAIVCILALAGPALAAFDLGTDTGITMQGFRTQGQGANGTTWSLYGAKAVIRGKLYELRDIVVVMQTADGRRTTIRSPECVYKQATELIESDAPVHVVGDDLDLRGVGYDILLASKKLRIRDKVSMTVRGASGTILERETDKTPPPPEPKKKRVE